MTKTIKTIVVLSQIFIFITACHQNKKDEAIGMPSISKIKIERYRVTNEKKDTLTLSSYIIKEFDSLGNEVRSIYYTKEDSIMMQFENSYTHGNKTKVTWRNKNNVIVRYVNMTYNKDGKIIKSESFKADGKFVEGYLHRWKDNGKIEEKGPLNDSIFRPNSIYSYTDFNEFETLIEYDLVNDSLYGQFQWKYTEFDSNKNWLNREVYFNEKLTSLEKREIKYLAD